MIELLTSPSELPIYVLLYIQVLMVATGYLLARAMHDIKRPDNERDPWR